MPAAALEDSQQWRNRHPSTQTWGRRGARVAANDRSSDNRLTRSVQFRQNCARSESKLQLSRQAVLRKVKKGKNAEALPGAGAAAQPAVGRRKRSRTPKVSRLQAKLAGQIVDLLRHQKLTAGAHVTEEFLTEQFKVSRSPVRAALRLLAQKGVFEARSNHGYFLVNDADEIEPTALDI